MIKAILFSFLYLSVACSSFAQTITTIAGTDSAGYNGDNIPAFTARLDNPAYITIDTAGNIYFADSDNYRIRKISTAGTITTVAGSGTAGYNGDNIPATDANINLAFGFALDISGNLYIADNLNNRIRKVNLAGIIFTIAGTGWGGFSGDNGPATAAEIWNPFGIVVDATGQIYFCESGNERIRKINTTGTISTVAGGGTLSGIGADGGPATNAKIQGPHGLAMDAAGNLYLAEYYGLLVRKISPSGIITTIAGNGSVEADNVPATSVFITSPTAITVDGMGNVYFCQPHRHRVRKVSAGGIITTIAGTGVAGYAGDGGRAVDAQLSGPLGLALNAAHDIFITEFGNDRIRRIQSTVSIPWIEKDIPGLDVYPNPSTGSFTVTLSGTNGLPATLVFSDVSGRVVQTTNIVATAPTTITLNQPPGVYWVTAYTTQGVYNTKVAIAE